MGLLFTKIYGLDIKLNNDSVARVVYELIYMYSVKNKSQTKKVIGIHKPTDISTLCIKISNNENAWSCSKVLIFATDNFMNTRGGGAAQLITALG